MARGSCESRLLPPIPPPETGYTHRSSDSRLRAYDEPRPPVGWENQTRPSFRKLECASFLYFRLGQEVAHFKDQNHGQVAHKKEHLAQEHSDGADVSHPVPARRIIHSPGRSQEITVQANHHDDETLEPHADENDSGNQKQCDWTGSQFANPQHLRDKDVTSQQRQIPWRIGAMQPVPEKESIESVAAVPSHESLDRIAVRHNQPGREHDFR